MSSIEETTSTTAAATTVEAAEVKTETSIVPAPIVNPFAGLTSTAVPTPTSNANTKEEDVAAEGEDNEVKEFHYIIDMILSHFVIFRMVMLRHLLMFTLNR